MTSAPSRSEAWEAVRSLEDIMALVARVDERREVIRQQAWGRMDAIYTEAAAMRVDLARLREALATCWERVVERARAGEDER